ncbi:MaoC/PaaZ C-terminal domain-containing protein [Streptomyces sp. NPDC059373]
MPLLLTLAGGVLTGIGKHPSAGAMLPDTRLRQTDVRIDAGRVAAYARVCGFGTTEPVPLTYPHILGFPLAAKLMAARSFPLPLLGLVHTSIEITQHWPLSVHDRPELTVYAEELRPHHRGTEAVVVTEARLDGTLVWYDRSTYLSRHRTDRTAPSEAPPVDPPAGAGHVEEWRLPAGLGRRHAAVSGDYNPIHLYPWTARPFGFSRPIAHGMWTFARCVAAAAPPTDRPVTARAEFRAPVLLPATVTYAAEGGAFELRGRDRLHVTGTVGPG